MCPKSGIDCPDLAEKLSVLITRLDLPFWVLYFEDEECLEVRGDVQELAMLADALWSARST